MSLCEICRFVECFTSNLDLVNFIHVRQAMLKSFIRSTISIGQVVIRVTKRAHDIVYVALDAI